MHEWIGGEHTNFFVEFIEAGKERLVVHFGQLFPRLLLHFDFILKLGKVERQGVHLGLPLHQNLRFKLKSEFFFPSIATFLEPSVGDASPRGEQSAHLVAADRVCGVVQKASLASAHCLQVAPSLHDLAQDDLVAALLEEASQAAILLLLLL